MLRKFNSHRFPLLPRPLLSSVTPCLSTHDRSFSSASPPSTPANFPTQSRVCIIGGGVIGCSVAYHLAKLGWKDIVLLERGQLSCGTTWHAAGLIGQLRDTETETKLSGVYGAKLLQSLEEETGLSTGFKSCGSLTLASNADRVTQLKIRAAKARSFGIEGHLISPKEALEMYPYLHIDDLHAALWLPGDGSAISSDVTQALARGARLASNNGVRIFENCKVVGISTTHSPYQGAVNKNPIQSENSSGIGINHVRRVHTNHGDIDCDIIVNCGGLWARQIGAMCGVSVPLASAEHYYIYSRPFQPQVPSMLPILRDPDAYIYYREWSGGLLMGGFEPVAKPVFEGINGPPQDFSFSLLPEDWDHFEILMKGALHRTPCLGDAQIKMINGPESFTPDNQYILGESPEVKGFYVAAGFNSSGIASSGGAGKALAEWIVNGEPTLDLWSVDIRRFNAQVHNNSKFLSARVAETLGLHYQITWPKRELESGRGLRKSSLYDTHRQLNACFGSKFGWERVNFFVPEDSIPLQQREQREQQKGQGQGKEQGKGKRQMISMVPYSYGRQWWFDLVGKEHQNCRDEVTLFDITSFSKILIQGADAVHLLQELCVNNIDVPLPGNGSGSGNGNGNGKLVYTSMCNSRGGIETDVTICRLKYDKFLLITATSQGTRDLHWIQSNLEQLKLRQKQQQQQGQQQQGQGQQQRQGQQQGQQLNDDDDDGKRSSPLRSYESIQIIDVTSSESVLSLMGPRSRELLSQLTSHDLSPEAFPFGTFQSLDLHCLVNVRAHRITYVGELGYELYIPTESTQLVYDALHAAAAATATATSGDTSDATSGDTSGTTSEATSGTTSGDTSEATSGDSSVSVTRGPIGLRNGGYFAIDSLRLEKGYRAWGHDITPNETPLEAGLGFTIDWNKDYAFIGREALWKQKQEGVQKKLVSVIIEEPIGHSSSPSSSPSSPSPSSSLSPSSSPSGNAPAGYAYGGEPLYRDGILVGYLTSAGYGYSLQKSIGLAYVSSKNLPTSEGKPVVVDLKFLRQGSYEIELADGRYRCRVTTKPPYDPSGNKIFC